MKSLSDLNTKITLATAVISSICLVLTTANRCTIDSLNQKKATAGLVSDLTEDLALNKARRDISLLALEHTLNPVLHKDHHNNDKLLLARITSYLITNPQISSINSSEFTKNNRGTIPGQNTLTNKAVVNSSLGDITVATRILADMILESKKENCINEFHKLDGVNPEQLNLNLLESRCGRAYTAAAQGLIKGRSLDKDANNPSPSLSTLAFAEQESEQPNDAASPNQVLPSIARATVIDVLRQKKLSNEAEKNDSSNQPKNSLANVIIHVDNRSRLNKLNDVRNKLSKENWYIAPGTKVVKPTEPSCAEYSSVRYFHDDDHQLAEDLKKQTIKELIETDNLGKLTQIKNKDLVKLINLSTWTYAKSVPNKTLELWLATEGKTCEKEKQKQITNKERIKG